MAPEFKSAATATGPNGADPTDDETCAVRANARQELEQVILGVLLRKRRQAVFGHGGTANRELEGLPVTAALLAEIVRTRLDDQPHAGPGQRGDGSYQKITFYGDNYMHDDELAWAACELFVATGEAQYRQKLYEWLPDPGDPATFRWGWWRMTASIWISCR